MKMRVRITRWVNQTLPGNAQTPLLGTGSFGDKDPYTYDVSFLA
jgi:hypothetical protein